MTNERRVPVGRVARLVKLAGVGARTGVGMVLSDRAARAAAEHAADALGNLRGLAAKVGQMVSYVDGFVPEQHAPAFEKALKTLQSAARTSSPAEIRGAVERELGAAIESLFETWNDEPIASASIGQVHRATLAGGRPVAVKVQHPGIERAIEDDLQNANVLQSIVGTIAPKSLDPQATFDEIRTRFREELDYCLEADRQRSFAEFFAHEPLIRIPAVIVERSSRRVLTTELVTGRHLDDIAGEPEPVRRQYAQVLWQFVFQSCLVAGMFNADPHPGNYLFQPDGGIAFLDFGCVQPLAPGDIALARDMHQAAALGDEHRFAAATRALLRTRGGKFEDQVLLFSRRCFEPLFRSPFRIDRRFASSLAQEIRAMKQVMWTRGSGAVALPAGLLFMNRLQFGFYSVLARLDVEVDYSAVERRFLPP